jgi:hypothetical protein
MSSLLWKQKDHAENSVAQAASPNLGKTTWKVPCIDLPSFARENGLIRPHPAARRRLASNSTSVEPHEVVEGGGALRDHWSDPHPDDHEAQGEHHTKDVGEQKEGAVEGATLSGGTEAPRVPPTLAPPAQPTPTSVARKTLGQVRPHKLFVKMDIEGGEALLLPTLKDWFFETRASLLVSIHIAHVNHHSKAGYPQSGIIEVGKVIASFAHVYRSHPLFGFDVNPVDTQALRDSPLQAMCHDCEYLCLWEPPPRSIFEAAKELEEHYKAVAAQEKKEEEERQAAAAAAGG